MTEDSEVKRGITVIAFFVVLGVCYWVSGLQPVNYWLSWIIYLPIGLWNGEEMPSFFSPFPIGEEAERIVFAALGVFSFVFMALTKSVGVTKCRRLIKADSVKLFRVAQYDRDPDIQKLAINAIGNEEVLQRIADGEIEPTVRKTAMKRMRALGFAPPENAKYIGPDISQKSLLQILAVVVCVFIWLFMMKRMGDQFMEAGPTRDYFLDWIVYHVLFRGLILGALMASIFVSLHHFTWKRLGRYARSFPIYHLASIIFVALLIYSISESGLGLQTSGGTLVYKGTNTYAGRATVLTGWEGPVANTTGLMATLAIVIYYYPLPWQGNQQPMSAGRKVNDMD